MRMIAASAAIKPLYDPIKIGRDYYSDGGSIAGLVMKAINAGCDTIFVLFPYPKVYYPRGSQDDFVSRYIPWFKDFLASYSAELRARDHDEIERVTPYNQRIRHEAEIAHLRETKDGILGIWKARLSRLLTRLKQVRIIPLYAEPPETFDLKSFKKGDFDIVRRRAREMVPRIIEPFLK
jgi:predicted patatin/cPLA2 family phospholipase